MGRKRGQPTKLTPEVQGKIVLTISQSGSYATVAAQAAGISNKTFYNWLTRGAQGRQPYLSFLEAVRKAEAQAEVKTGAKVFKGNKNWVSAATWLERTKRERWSRSDKLLIGPLLGPQEFHITGPGGVGLKATKLIDVTPDKGTGENGL